MAATGGPSAGGGADAAVPDALTVLPDGAVVDRDGSFVDIEGGTAIVPSHVGAVVVDAKAPDLSGVVAIDTTSRLVKTESGAVPGLRFDDVGGIAVLFVGSWTVGREVKITGDARLVVVAARAVTVSALLDGSAHHETPGPGGAKPRSGPGVGGSAVPVGTDHPGGGGAGFGIAGAKGGNGNGNAALGGGGGAAYGALLSDFLGGSGGGQGSPYNVLPCIPINGNGGAGGGALQITSAISITVDADGEISTGGGGGQGGCLNGNDNTMSGGGGGSGGTIFLEAPIISVLGKLASNGGGGGGGAQISEDKRGEPGDDGTRSLEPAQGGDGAGDDRNGGAGATRTALPSTPDGNHDNAGGGGGAYGRIWLRTRTTPATVTGADVLTPPPALDTGF